MAKILLAEDYPSLQKIYQETLELDNHTVFLAANAEEAMDIAKKEKLDIILLDLLLQQTWGLDFLKEFDARKHPTTKTIIISNLFSNEILNDALKLGAKHFLIKSELTPKQLTKVVHETLEEIANEQKS